MSRDLAGRDLLFGMLREFSTKFADNAALKSYIDILTAAVKSDADAQFALLGWDVGVRVGLLGLSAHSRRALRAGFGAIEGGKIGAQAVHAAAEAKKDRARKIYAHYAAKIPRASRKELCLIVAQDLKVEARTIAQWVPNPKPDRRGRPRKH